MQTVSVITKPEQKTARRNFQLKIGQDSVELVLVLFLFIVILQYIIRQHNNNRDNVYCNMFRLRRVIIRLII
jgi:hypothetical protein